MRQYEYTIIYNMAHTCACLRGQNLDVFKFDEFLNFAVPLSLVKVIRQTGEIRFLSPIFVASSKGAVRTLWDGGKKAPLIIHLNTPWKIQVYIYKLLFFIKFDWVFGGSNYALIKRLPFFFSNVNPPRHGHSRSTWRHDSILAETNSYSN